MKLDSEAELGLELRNPDIDVGIPSRVLIAAPR